VSYYVRFERGIEDFLRTIEGLSTAARAAVIDGVIEELGRDADKFLALNPLGPESLHFRYDYVQPDGDTLFVFDFIVDGTEMAVGVVTVVFAECETHRAG
jgi:hypothetical protein